MAEKQTTDNNGTENIDPISTYHILLQYHKEENRLLSERTTIFLAASSILFLAFVMLFQTPNTNAWISSLKIILPILGIFLTCVFHSLVRGTLEQLEFLWQAQRNIERDSPVFRYNNEVIGPQTYRIETRRDGFLARNASKWCIPAAFWVLWGASLVVAIIPTPPA